MSALAALPDRDVEALTSHGSTVPGAWLTELLREGEVLHYKKPGIPSVVRLRRRREPDLLVKIWYRKRELSSDWLKPYSARFVNNCRRLRAAGFLAPRVLGSGRIRGAEHMCREPRLARHAHFVSYEALPGEPLAGQMTDADLDHTARFVLSLHETGIDFRGMHLGNILFERRTGQHSLIDVTDVRFKARPLPLQLRARRLARLCEPRPGQPFWDIGGNWSRFVLSYCSAMGTSLEDTAAIHGTVHRLVERRLARA